MRKNRASQIDVALIAAVADHPRDLTHFVAASIGVSRQTTATRARALVAEGRLTRTASTRPTYLLGPVRFGQFQYPLQNLVVDAIGSRDLAPLLRGLPASVSEIVLHGVGELLHNARDHSQGQTVTVTVFNRNGRVSLWVADDGSGIFHRLTDALRLSDAHLAVLELAKGKFTSDPAQHTGEGLFFTCRAFDHFEIQSNGLTYEYTADADAIAMPGGNPFRSTTGTMAFGSIAANSERTLQAVLNTASSRAGHADFSATLVPVRLARLGSEALLSRSQARQVLRRLDQFQRVTLDFSDIASIGRAFADEIFRVFARAHANVQITTTNVAPEIQDAIRGVARASTTRVPTAD